MEVDPNVEDDKSEDVRIKPFISTMIYKTTGQEREKSGLPPITRKMQRVREWRERQVLFRRIRPRGDDAQRGGGRVLGLG